jgi:hypothetical protein
MLRRSGFGFVYGFEMLPNNEFYRTTRWRARMRTMMLASRVELQCENLVSLEDCQNISGYDSPAWKTTRAMIRDRFMTWKMLLAKIRDRRTSV